MKRKLTNQGMMIFLGLLTGVIFITPFIILLKSSQDKIFQSPTQTLSLFTVIVLIFVLLFFKKLVKAICRILTPLGFGSLLVMIISMAITSFLDDLTLIATVSVISSVAAWLPYQLTLIYSRFSHDEKGNVIVTPHMSFKEAFGKIFQITITFQGDK